MIVKCAYVKRCLPVHYYSLYHPVVFGQLDTMGNVNSNVLQIHSCLHKYMPACIYVYIIYMHVCMCNTRMHTHAHAHTHTRTCAHTHTHTHMRIHTHTSSEVPVQYSVMSHSSLADRHMAPDDLSYDNVKTGNNNSLL